jgi:hypothetical protein
MWNTRDILIFFFLICLGFSHHYWKLIFFHQKYPPTSTKFFSLGKRDYAILAMLLFPENNHRWF